MLEVTVEVWEILKKENKGYSEKDLQKKGFKSGMKERVGDRKTNNNKCSCYGHQTVSVSVQPFLQGSQVCPAERQTATETPERTASVATAHRPHRQLPTVLAILIA